MPATKPPEISKRDIENARKAEADAGPRVIAARYRRSTAKIEVDYANGVTIAVPVALIEELSLLPEPPTAAGLSSIEIMGDGRYIDFPKIDASVHAPSILKGIFGTKAWMSEIARGLGSAKSPAKAAAARENGKKGGRPRKQAAPAETEKTETSGRVKPVVEIRLAHAV